MLLGTVTKAFLSILGSSLYLTSKLEYLLLTQIYIAWEIVAV